MHIRIFIRSSGGFQPCCFSFLLQDIFFARPLEREVRRWEGPGLAERSLWGWWETISLLMANTHWSHCAQPLWNGPNSPDEDGGWGYVDRKSEHYWPEAASDRLPNIFCKNWVRSTPTHYGNSQLLKADVWTNDCGERAAGTGEGHRVRPQDQGFFCVSWYDLFIPVILVSLDSFYFICPIKQFCKSQSLHRLCCH